MHRAPSPALARIAAGALVLTVAGCPREREEKATDDPTGAAPARAEDAAVPGDDDLVLVLGMLGARTDREVEVVLDRGAFDGDDWLSEAVGGDRLASPALPIAASEGSLARGHGRLTFGPAVAIVTRVGCGPVEVPYRVGAVDTVVLPYPSCAATAAAVGPIRAGDLRRARALGVLSADPDAPVGDDDAPARWLRHDEAVRYCAWLGLSLDAGPPACTRLPPS